MGTELANSSKIMADVEEGEISDSASVEEISEEDFKKEDVKDVKQSSPKVTKDTGVWTMTDLYKYQMRGGYVSSLYNLAWARAVQNKPLNDMFVEVEPEENKNDNNNSKRSSPSSSVASVNSCSSKTGKRKAEEVVIDDSGDEGDVQVLEDVEKEEGELEEGEIDLDLDVIAEKAAGEEGKKCDGDGGGGGVMSVDGLKSEELEKKVTFIRGALESVTVMEVTKSFQEVCSKLHSTLESLWVLVLETDVPTKSALSQLAFTAFGVVSTVFSSLNHQLKEKNKVCFSRLLALVDSHDHHLFSPEQIREISVMVFSLDSRNDLSTMASGVKENESQIAGKANVNCASAETASHDMNTKTKLPVTESLVQNKLNTSLEAPKAGLSNFRSRGLVLPLLDLHKDHDLDSLPSPTRETAPSLPVHRRVLPGGDGTIKSSLPTAKVAPDAREPRMHPYQTDAFKAFSSYQQKFGVGSLFSSDLHSPTPSEGSNDGDGDTDVEVSSSSTVSSLRNVDRPTVGQQIPPPLPPAFPDNSISHGAIPVKNHAPISSGSISTVKASAKSRDPRLRFVNNDACTLNHEQRSVPMANNASKMEPINLRKQKILEDLVVDGPAVKRQRSVWENPAANGTRSGGWLEDTDMVGPQTVTRNQFAENVERDPRKKDNRVTYPGIGAGSANGTGTSNLPNNVNEQIPVRGVSPITLSEPVSMTSNIVTALPDLLKDIAINPTILINLLKMGQQQRLALDSQPKVTEPAKNASHPLSSNPTVGVPAVASVAPALFSETFSRPNGKPQVPSQACPMDELGKVRMKPRDPRRILHNNTLQRSGSVGSEQFKTDITSPSTTNGSKDFQNLHKQDIKAEGKAVPSQSFAAPDISLQFTKSLKNIADIVSVSQASSTQPFVSKNLAVSMQNNSDKVDPQAAMPNSGNQTGAGITAASAPETAAVGAHTQNAWGDVEHLFEGYDDKQKAAIQRERSRRIEEQKKLFAARKLCLVLDLDHTLLNSAKFVEVDPMHDEILRKKEEQDREKPYRHLYRFPHMGMWTKLRPGIWNFLERASKLFELHLYTMGNKLYATEMAKVLDPTGVLFSGRVISRGDDGDPFDSDDRVPKTKDLEGVLGMESGVVIIDDSVRVWPHNKLNLIVVERYIYFPCSRRQFGLPGPSLLEIDHDERSEDGTLASSLAVIERLHQNFFSHRALDEVDVRNILASEQRKILGGCRILFSRVFPVGESNPHLHPLWQTAEQFGGVCVNQIDEQVTHVVANSLGTDKVNWALTTGRFVVHPGWVEASALLYRRAREQDFAIKP